MVILDTNVISALALPRPERRILDWLDRQKAQQVWTTAVTVFELWRGIARLPEGRRRQDLEGHIPRLLASLLDGRVLAFDEAAAQNSARIWALRLEAGRPIHAEDCQIAGIALAHDAVLATRDLRDFAGCGLRLIDPWGG